MTLLQTFQQSWLPLLSSKLSGALLEVGLLGILPLLLLLGDLSTVHSLGLVISQMIGKQGSILPQCFQTLIRFLIASAHPAQVLSNHLSIFH